MINPQLECSFFYIDIDFTLFLFCDPERAGYRQKGAKEKTLVPDQDSIDASA